MKKKKTELKFKVIMCGEVRKLNGEESEREGGEACLSLKKEERSCHLCRARAAHTLTQKKKK